jgi:DNA polymerase-3 subunit alpha
MARLSDPSGQFDATVFEDDVAQLVEQAAKRRVRAARRRARPQAGEEAPRVTIRSVTGFDALSRRTRLQLEIEADDPAAIAALAQLLASRRGGSCAVRLKVHHGRGEAQLLLGRDFLVDAELAAQVERIVGIVSIRLSAEAKPQLQLVG